MPFPVAIAESRETVSSTDQVDGFVTTFSATSPDCESSLIVSLLDLVVGSQTIADSMARGERPATQRSEWSEWRASSRVVIFARARNLTRDHYLGSGLKVRVE